MGYIIDDYECLEKKDLTPFGIGFSIYLTKIFKKTVLEQRKLDWDLFGERFLALGFWSALTLTPLIAGLEGLLQ